MANDRGRGHQVGPHQAPEIDRHQAQQAARAPARRQARTAYWRSARPEARTRPARGGRELPDNEACVFGALHALAHRSSVRGCRAGGASGRGRGGWAATAPPAWAWQALARRSPARSGGVRRRRPAVQARRPAAGSSRAWRAAVPAAWRSPGPRHPRWTPASASSATRQPSAIAPPRCRSAGPAAAVRHRRRLITWSPACRVTVLGQHVQRRHRRCCRRP